MVPSPGRFLSHLSSSSSGTRSSETRSSGERSFGIRARHLTVWLAVAALGVTACDTAVPARVLYLGDSVMAEAMEEVTNRSLFHTHAYHTIPQAIGGSGLKDLDSYWLPRIRALQLARVEWDAVVIHSGFNDAATGPMRRAPLDADDYARRIDALLEAVGDVPVLWFDIPRNAPLEEPRRDLVNRAIRGATTRWPNLTVLWSSALFVDCPECFDDDQIHRTQIGQERLAEIIIERLDELFPPEPSLLELLLAQTP